MTIDAIALTPVKVCLSSDASLLDALDFMLEHDLNHVPLCSSGHWVGLVSITQVLKRILPVSVTVEGGLTDLAFAGDARNLLAAHLHQLAGVRAETALDPKLPVLHAGDGLLESALLLYRQEVPLPVLNPDGSLKGMLSRRALLSHLKQIGG